MTRPKARSKNTTSIASVGLRKRPDFPRRLDPEFRWATDDPALEAWVTALASWVAACRSKAPAIHAGNALLDYMRAHPGTASTPEVLCRRDTTPLISFEASIANTRRNRSALVNPVYEFFSWYLDTHLSALDDQERTVRSPDHYNPVARRLRKAALSETSKAALPTRYLRELYRLLTQNDWKWAKTFERDWMKRTDPLTGKVEKVWCPVRGTALALKLLLPLRTFQIRMLDSGEGDSFVHGPEGWVPNVGPHAPVGGRSVRQGFLRCFADRASGRELTGLFVNTNKTAAHMPGSTDPGYEIPWEHKEVIKLVDDLVAWQARHNPVLHELPWSEVDAPEVRLSGTIRGGGAYFLMRDPCGADPAQPLSDKAPSSLWVRLLETLEGQLAVRRETRPDGSPIQFIRWCAKRRNPKALFGLHSLRVSLLTALATDGGVPLHILSKVVAGHASLVMTLYYIKTDPAQLSRCLIEATDNIDAAQQADFARYLASETRAESGFVSNDAAGPAALAQSDSGLWKTLTTGICPVGGTRCGDGGPLIGGRRHAPVPGGPLNCVACRFHISGPAFLPGLVARFNAASLAMEGARREHQVAEAGLLAAEDARYDRETGDGDGGGGGGIEVARAHNRLENADARLGVVVGTMQAAYGLIERCKAVARTSDAGVNLVLGGTVEDLTVSVRETSQLDLWDAVCRGAQLHPCSEVSEAVLRRSQAFDRLLARNGSPIFFMNLPDELALSAGNEMVRMLTQQLGREVALNVIDGRSDALEGEVTALVESIVAQMPSGALALPGVVGGSR